MNGISKTVLSEQMKKDILPGHDVGKEALTSIARERNMGPTSLLEPIECSRLNTKNEAHRARAVHFL